MKDLINKNIKKSYKELKIAIDKMNSWLELNIIEKFESNYKNLKTQTDEIIDKIWELKIKISEQSQWKWKMLKKTIWKSSKIIKEKTDDYKEEIKELYDKLKILAWKMDNWLEEKQKQWIINSMKLEYKKAQDETKKLFQKISEMKTDIIDDKFIEIPYNSDIIHVSFNNESWNLSIWEDKYRVSEIVINEDIKDKSIKIDKFLVKKEKPIISILIPSNVAKKHSIWKNYSKPFIIEWIIKRDKIAEFAEWLVLYSKGTIKEEINWFNVAITMAKI